MPRAGQDARMISEAGGVLGAGLQWVLGWLCSWVLGCLAAWCGLGDCVLGSLVCRLVGASGRSTQATNARTLALDGGATMIWSMRCTSVAWVRGVPKNGGVVDYFRQERCL